MIYHITASDEESHRAVWHGPIAGRSIVECVTLGIETARRHNGNKPVIITTVALEDAPSATLAELEHELAEVFA